MARCPAHEDGTESLSVKETEDRILLKCHAGCTAGAIVAAMDLTLGDLFFEKKDGYAESEIEAVYEYTDGAGKPVFEVVRFVGKRFLQRLPGAEDWGLKGLTPLPIFHLPEVQQGIREGRAIYITEGEKDALAIQRAGGVATCAAGGAGKWHHNYAHYLRGAKKVWIVADKDEPGIAHAEMVGKSLTDIDWEIVQAKEGKDAYDHLEAGGTLMQGSAPFIPMPKSYHGVSVVKGSMIIPSEVKWIPGWEGYFPFAGLAHVAGMPGVNKSTLTCKLAADVTRLGFGVMLVGSEDSRDSVVIPRLLAAGADMDKVIFPTKYVTFPHDIEGVQENMEAANVKLLVIDPVDAHLDHDVDSHKNQSIRGALAPLAFMADVTHAAVVLVGHPNKGSSKDPMMRVGGSIGIPGISRSAMIMGFHPDYPAEDGMRVVASYKGNWARRPQARVFRVELTAAGNMGTSIKLSEAGQANIYASQLLPRTPTEGREE